MRTSNPHGDGWRCAMGLGVVWVLVGVCGCPTRTMTIEVDQFINVSEASPKGQPLAVDIVSVFPSDLSGNKDREAANELLRTEKAPTAKVWFARRPTHESMQNKQDTSRFQLDNRQIVSFTRESQGARRFYGTRAAGLLVGTVYKPEQKAVVVEKIPISKIFEGGAVVYVFCKFQDAKGNVRPTKPAAFWRVGDFTDRLQVRIHKQHIERMTKRTFGKDLEWMKDD